MVQPGFLLVADSQNDERIMSDPIPCDVAAVAEADRPFSMLFREVFNRAADVRLMPEHLQGFHDGFAGALGRGRISWLQELTQALQVPNRAR